MMNELETLGQGEASPDNWRKLVDAVREGFRDLYPTRFTRGQGLGSFARFLIEFVHGGWDRVFDGPKNESMSTQ